MRKLALLAGLGVLIAVWAGPLLDTWRDSFAAHMVAHMGVIAVATPLIAIGISRWFSSRLAISLGLPLVASVLELIAVWGWHAPALRAAAESSMLATIAEQLTFLMVGLFLWCNCLSTGGGRSHAAAGAAALLVTSVHMTLLGALLTLSQRPLFGEQQVSCFGVVLDGAQDQQLGGTVMLTVGAVVYLAGGLWLLSGLLNTEQSDKANGTCI